VGEPRPPAGSPEERPSLDRPASETETLSAVPAASRSLRETGELDREDQKPEHRPAPPGKQGGPVKEKEGGRGFLGFLKELPGLVLIAFALALLIKTFLIQAFYIPSQSMVPTLKVGDRVLVNKVLYDFGQVQRLDVIVFENPDLEDPDRGFFGAIWAWLIEGLGVSTDPNRDFIKRVIGLPGDTVEVREGKVLVNGEPLGDEPYARDERDRTSYGPETVPEDRYFVMGDNRANSQDSRSSLGFVPEDKIVGKAFVLLWPPSRIEWLSDD
jgi:signal peptidase I